MAEASVIVRLIDQASGALSQIRSSLGALGTTANQTTEQTDKLAQSQSNLKSVAANLITALAATGVAGAMRSAAEAAQAAENATRVLSNTAQAAGINTDTLNKALGDVSSSLGLTQDQLAGAAAQMIRAGYSVDQIKDAFIAGGASALAMGKSAAAGVENVAMALSTGQSVYLNYIGISENIAAQMQKAANAVKNQGEAAKEAASRNEAMRIILKATQSEVQSLDVLMGGLAGAQNKVTQEAYKLQVEIGKTAKEAFTQLYSVLGNVLQQFNALSPEIKSLITNAGLAVTAVVGLSAALGVIIGPIKALIEVLGSLRVVMAALFVGPQAVFVVAVAAVAALAGAAWVKLRGEAAATRRELEQLAKLAGTTIENAQKSRLMELATIEQNLLSQYRELRTKLQAAGNNITAQDRQAIEKEMATITANLQAVQRTRAALARTAATPSTPAQTAQAVQAAQTVVQNTQTAVQNTQKALQTTNTQIEKTTSNVERQASAFEQLKTKYDLGQIAVTEYRAGLEKLVPLLQQQLDKTRVGSEQWQKYAAELKLAQQELQKVLSGSYSDIGSDLQKQIDYLNSRLVAMFGKTSQQIQQELAQFDQDVINAEWDRFVDSQRQKAESWARAWQENIDIIKENMKLLPALDLTPPTAPLEPDPSLPILTSPPVPLDYSARLDSLRFGIRYLAPLMDADALELLNLAPPEPDFELPILTSPPVPLDYSAMLDLPRFGTRMLAPLMDADALEFINPTFEIDNSVIDVLNSEVQMGETGPFEALLNLLPGLLAPLGELNKILNSLNPVAAMVAGFMETLGQMISELMAPFVELGSIIAKLLGPAFAAIAPIVRLVVLTLGGFALAVAKIWNALAWLLEKVTFGVDRLYVDDKAIEDALKRIADGSNNAADGLQRLSNSVNLVSGYGYTGVALAQPAITVNVQVSGVLDPYRTNVEVQKYETSQNGTWAWDRY